MTILDTLRADLARLEGYRDMPHNLRERESRLLRLAIKAVEQRNDALNLGIFTGVAKYVEIDGTTAVVDFSCDRDNELEAILKGE